VCVSVFATVRTVHCVCLFECVCVRSCMRVCLCVCVRPCGFLGKALPQEFASMLIYKIP
jgi:hypothetical protein